jgi:hypothetical protein
MYKGGAFTVPAELYDPMFDYIATESAVTQKQAMGYLKLLYHNNIGLTSCSYDMIEKFDKKFLNYWP